MSTSLSDNIRLSAFAIAGFDCLQTIPGEFRLYRKHWRRRRLSLLCVLFFLVRYCGLITLIANGVGFFDHNFPQHLCPSFYLVHNTFRFMTGFVAECIIFLRTYCIVGRSRKWLIALTVLAVLCFPVQVWASYYKRFPGSSNGNCAAQIVPGEVDSGPYLYIAQSIFDLTATAIGTGHIISQFQGFRMILPFTKMVLEQGILYCFATTLANVLVLLSLYHVPGADFFGSTLSTAVTLIMSQHLVLNVQVYQDDVQISTSKPPTVGVGPSTGSRRQNIELGSLPQYGRHTETDGGGVRIQTETYVSSHTTPLEDRKLRGHSDGYSDAALRTHSKPEKLQFNNSDSDFLDMEDHGRDGSDRQYAV